MSPSIDDNESGSVSHRRSSFVPPAERTDFTPILPVVNDGDTDSHPESPASPTEINFFPPVSTGTAVPPAPTVAAPPTRTEIPARKSFTEAELAAVFGSDSSMSSTEQISLLESQSSLREADATTATAFLDTINRADPADAHRLLSELQKTFGDVAPELLTVALTTQTETEPESVGDAPSLTEPAKNPSVETTPSASDFAEVSASQTGETPQATEWNLTIPETGDNGMLEPVSRHRWWGLILIIAVAVGVLIPLSAAIFTTAGNPFPDQVESMIGLPGTLAVLAALGISFTLAHFAARRSTIMGNSWRIAAWETLGKVSGTIVSALVAVSVLVSLFLILSTATRGFAAFDKESWFTPIRSMVGPAVHLPVLATGVLVFLGFLLATLPRFLYRDKLLVLGGATAGGAGLVAAIGLGIIGSTKLSAPLSTDWITLAGATVPIAAVLIAGSFSAINHVTRRDEGDHGNLWFVVGLGLGAIIGGGSLALQLLSAGAEPFFAGDNPVIRVQSAFSPWHLVLGGVAFGLPLVMISALIGRTVAMSFVRDDRRGGWVVLRLVLLLVPVAFVAADIAGMGESVSAFIPTLTCTSVPVMAYLGTLAGASIASFRDLAPWARIVNGVVTVLITIAGLVVTATVIPAVAPLVESPVGSIMGSLGVDSTVMTLVPLGSAVLALVMSLIVTALGAVRSSERS